MRLDWSRLVIGVMVVFVLSIVSMGVKMIGAREALYEEDYYEQGEMYASRMDKERVASAVFVSLDGNQLDIRFDSAGYVLAYRLICLSDSKADFREMSSSRDAVHRQSFLLTHILKEGNWMIEMEGVVNDNSFFKKQAFVR